ncbi:MAG TPA: molybdopterin cofactor-binding domain-containing protein, partial [Bryobacteraceae bacterium]|nr:molybdopterin cofactor-binding domain-containing protein [Bryobacteraceae bacterium]
MISPSSRRGFLQASGALIVGFSLRDLPQLRAQAGPVQGAPPMNQLDSWIAIAADGSVTAFSGKEELGQGISVAQAQLVAEELCVPFERVKLVYCDTALTPDQAYTSGSQSHPANFNRSNLAQAAATARQALLRLASQRLNLPVSQLSAKDGVVFSSGDPSRKFGYGELLGGRQFRLPLDPAAPRKTASQWTVLGTPVPRPDLPALVTGQFEFVHNVRLPGMLHGRVVRPPAVGAAVRNVDEASVQDIPGLVKVVVRNNFVGVVAHKPWQAVQAAARLKVDWSPALGLPPQADFYQRMRADKQTRDTLVIDSGDTARNLARAALVLKATYKHPYQMHGSLGSSCAVADVQGDRAVLYSPTQGVWRQRNTSAMLLGLKPENVRVVFRRGSGCYGLNGADAVTYDAALLSQAVQKPVRVQLSRKDEMAWENFGHAY